MRAAVLHSPHNLSLEDRPDPVPGPGAVVLDIETTTLCGTDVRLFTGAKTSGVVPDVVVGHEIAGRVSAVGDGLPQEWVGRQATVSIVLSCGACDHCLRDREHLCERLRLFGYALDGGLAEKMLVPAEAVARGNLILTPQDLPPALLALAEPVSCCLNGLDQYRVNPGDTVVVIGAGPIGLLHTQLARYAGAGQVIVANRGEDRRRIAEQLGADLTLDPSAVDLVETVRDATNGRGADAVVVCIGAPDLANTALACAAAGGRVNYFAGFPKGSTAQMDPNLIHYNELEVTGGSNARRRDVRRAVDLLAGGAIDHDAIVTHTFSLDRIEEAYQAVADQLGVKMAIDPRI
ncbi:zinc-binding dehydrogenase [Parenemella sanctibonifatiensis]|uniref:Zinc-binding dehydrogenase n=1 Tax=Parenemella sanctibonifatiensis TaxID=2016505 RepID=A0A255E4F7_9ACTN|nr:zinc-binding dehydrogenase [Parenemella sanctibonifatiensis]OYN86376.1 zinc-binding dehydrogenase [Parenemella sanctibonifatiensis]